MPTLDLDHGPAHDELLRAVQPGAAVSDETFFGLVDQWQDAGYRLLFDAYKDETFSKLLAIKAANLIVRRLELQRRRRVLVVRPFQLTVDPANACQLACPGCIHGEKWKPMASWPKNTLELDRFQQFMRRFGPTAFAVMLYNFGEPLLNKNFPAFVRLAKAYQSFVAASTNLSLRIDPEAIVRSELDLLIMSIDGTTQRTYGRYRINGKLDQVFDNVRALVEARRKLGSNRPYLQWQFLAFEHNKHQLKGALRMAERLGVDCLKVVTPSEWGWEEGSQLRQRMVEFGVPFVKRYLQPADTPMRGEHKFRHIPPEIDLPAWRESLLTDEVSTAIDAAFGMSWVERFRRAQTDGIDRADSGTCTWLYDNITMDGAKRLLPCCLMPLPQRGQLVFGQLPAKDANDESDPVNTKLAVLSRLAFADPSAYETQTAGMPPTDRPFCATCTDKPDVPFGWPFPAWRLGRLDTSGVMGRMQFDALTSTS